MIVVVDGCVFIAAGHYVTWKLWNRASDAGSFDKVRCKLDAVLPGWPGIPCIP